MLKQFSESYDDWSDKVGNVYISTEQMHHILENYGSSLKKSMEKLQENIPIWG